MTLCSSTGGLLAGKNEMLGEQPTGKSSESFSAAVTGQYHHVHVCVCACEPACRAGCGSVPVRVHAAVAHSAEHQASSRASRHCNLHFFRTKARYRLSQMGLDSERPWRLVLLTS